MPTTANLSAGSSQAVDCGWRKRRERRKRRINSRTLTFSASNVTTLDRPFPQRQAAWRKLRHPQIGSCISKSPTGGELLQDAKNILFHSV